MKKTNKVKMGPLGTPLGNPLGYFNSSKGKKTEPKQTLRKARDGMSFNNTYAGPITESDSKRLDEAFPSTVNAPIPFAANKPNKGYGSEDMYREKENNDRGAFENYLRSPAVGSNNKRLGTGLNSEPLWNQKYNRESQISNMNKMNNIDWNSEEGVNTKRLLDRDYKEGFKKGGSVKSKMKKGGSHKMPNGKMMLNSAMKKKTSKNK